MSQVKKITDSAKELKNIYSLTGIAMLLALRVVLGFIANPTLPLFGSTHKLSGAFLPIAVSGIMFGPIPSAFVGALGDILSFMIQPTAGGYFPGFTVSGFLTGFIYGFAFYKKEITLPRVIIAWAVNMIAVETFLAAFWLYQIQNGTSFDMYLTLLIARFAGVAIKCVPEILLIFAVGKLTQKIKLPTKK